jgi:hypothetical protein
MSKVNVHPQIRFRAAVAAAAQRGASHSVDRQHLGARHRLHA